MKLLLLQPPVQDFYDTDIRLQPIGLCSLKAAVAKHLPEVKVIVKDYHLGWGKRSAALPKELSYLKDYYPYPDKSPFCSFHTYYHFGASFEAIAQDVLKENPDLVGISSLFSPYYREVLHTAESIKQQMDVPILIGGAHVSAVPRLMLSHPAVDFVVRGEGERALVEFLKAILRKTNLTQVPNLGFKTNGSLILNQVSENFSIDQLSHPDLSDLPSENYQFNKRPLGSVITSRGCPYHCTFCSVRTTFGQHYRRRDPEDVLQELKSRWQEGIRVFNFEDDNLTFDKTEMKHLCQLLIREFPCEEPEFLAMNGISYHNLDQELLQLMRKAGFTHLNLSLVSANECVLKQTKRPHTLGRYLEIVRAAHKLGFRMISYQILGLPNETVDSMIETIGLSARLPVLLGASIFYLTPGSPLAEDYNEDWEKMCFQARSTAIAVRNGLFDREDIYTLFVSCRIINFIKGLRFEQQSLSLDELLEKNQQGRHRTEIGVQLLRRLIREKKLYAWTKNGQKILPRFRGEVFEQLWSSLDTICTQQGQQIEGLSGCQSVGK